MKGRFEIGDLRHQHEVVAAFFALGESWITLSLADVSASLAEVGTPSSETVENALFCPSGPGSVEEILCRVTINELNALCEAALMQAAMMLAGSYFVEDDRGRTASAAGVDAPKPNIKGAFDYKRGELDELLRDNGIDIRNLEGYSDVLVVKEVAEGYKHRMGFAPMPRWRRSDGAVVDQESVLDGIVAGEVVRYEIDLLRIRRYVESVGNFLRDLRVATSSQL